MYDEGGLSIGEYLYSREGYQSAGISEHSRKRLNLDPTDPSSRFLFDVYSEKYGNKFYEMTPAVSISGFSSFQLKEIMLTKEHDSLVSVPMYCKMSGISVNEIDYELVVIKLKPEYDNRKFLDKFYGEFFSMIHYFENIVPDEDMTYENKLKIENWDINFKHEFERKASTLDGIFNVIVIISMALCFFSLSSSMSANIYD